MTNRPRAIGTAAETAVVKALRLNGFGLAERRSLKGGQDQGDVTGTPGICWEVKGGEKAREAHGRPALLEVFLTQTRVETANSLSDFGVLVLQRKGFTDAARWWAVVAAFDLAWLIQGADRITRLQEWPPTYCWLELGHLLPIIREAGYGDPATIAIEDVAVAGELL